MSETQPKKKKLTQKKLEEMLQPRIVTKAGLRMGSANVQLGCKHHSGRVTACGGCHARNTLVIEDVQRLLEAASASKDEGQCRVFIIHARQVIGALHAQQKSEEPKRTTRVRGQA